MQATTSAPFIAMQNSSSQTHANHSLQIPTPTTMSSHPTNSQPLYPTITQTDPQLTSPLFQNPSQSNPSSIPLYPSLDMKELVENLFPDQEDKQNPNPNPNPNSHPSAPPIASEELLIKIPGAIVHLIDKQSSVELACGDLMIFKLLQGENAIAVLARIDDEIQWPLAKDEPAVKLDDAHYFFSLRIPESLDPGDEKPKFGDEKQKSGDGSDNVLNYGVTFASKGQEGLLREFDGILEKYTGFSVQKISENGGGWRVLDGSVAKGISPVELESAPKRQLIEETSAAYWTTLAPNVEDYGGIVARGIAAGTGQLIRGILWCGDVTVERLNWGNEFLKKRMEPNAKPAEISKETMKRIKRARKVSKTSEKVVTGVLSGVVKVSGFFTSSVVNSKAGKKFFGLLPGEIVLASLDGFGKLCDAVEVVGKNVLSTSSTVTTGLVSHRYGEQAGEVTQKSLDTAGHALGTAWAVFKIRKGLNPKSAMKPTTLVKTAAKAASAGKKG